MKKIEKMLKTFTDKYHLNKVFGYAFYDSKNKRIIATDSFRMIIIEYDLGDEDFFINVNKLKDEKEYFSIKDFSFLGFKDEKLKFPDIDKILYPSKEFNKMIFDYHIDLATYITNVSAFIDKKIIIKFDKKYDTLRINLEEKLKISYVDYNKPLKFETYIKVKDKTKNEFLIKIIFIVMPVII